MSTRSIRGDRADHPDVGDGWSLPRMFGRGTVLIVVIAILAFGLGAAAILHRQAGSDSARGERDLVVRASRVLQASSGALAASLAGASAIVDPSGKVEQIRFEAFAKGAVGTTRVQVLAFVPVIGADERAEFEKTAGLAITEPGANGFISAAQRLEYLPVQFVYPFTETSRSVIGLDTASDPTRLTTSNAARDAGKLVFSAPVPSQPSGQTSVFFAEPLFAPGAPVATQADRRASIVGFATGLTSSNALLASVMEQLPSGARVSITDGDDPLSVTPAAPEGGHSAQIAQGDRMWTITVEYDSAAYGTTWLTLIATLVLAAAVGLFLLRNFRQTRELQLAAITLRQLGRLNERLAVADDRKQMIRTILQHVTSMVGSVSSRVLIQSRDNTFHATSCVRHGDTTTVVESEDVLINDTTAVGVALSTDAPVFVPDTASLRIGEVAGVDRAVNGGPQAGAALPMRRPNGQLMGAIELGWSRPTRFREGLRSTLLTIAEVCEQSLYRAEVQENRWRAASEMAELSQRLAVSRTLDHIAQAVVRYGPPASGADHVAVGFVNDAGNELQVFHSSLDEASGTGPASFEFPVDPRGVLMAQLRSGKPVGFTGAVALERFPTVHQLVGERLDRIMCMPLIDAGSHLRGIVAYVYLTNSDLRMQPEAHRLETIADLAAQTVERAQLYEHEHELVVNLQRQTLADLPDVKGLVVAARYLPASSLLGLGGDWYDVYVLDERRVGVVVGDVAGHGIDAIADMTEFRTTISTLLRSNHELGDLPAMCTALLNDDGASELRFATVGLMILDVCDQQLSYVRAGHPPSMVRTPEGEILVLEAGGSAPIGIASSEVHRHELAVPSGSVIVAYTDGLIERRDEGIDAGLDRLAAALRDCESGDPEVIADAVIAHCLGGRQTDDDAAVLVILVE